MFCSEDINLISNQLFILLEFSLHRAISVIHIVFLLSLTFPNFSFKPELHFKSVLSGKEKNYSIYMCVCVCVYIYIYIYIHIYI